jgi:hypothetical protein
MLMKPDDRTRITTQVALPDERDWILVELPGDARESNS